jgi:hypothetical protein
MDAETQSQREQETPCPAGATATSGEVIAEAWHLVDGLLAQVEALIGRLADPGCSPPPGDPCRWQASAGVSP